MENSMKLPQKTQNKATIWPSNPTTGHIPWENQSSKRHMYRNVQGFPGSSDGKESACNLGHLGSILGSGKSPGDGNGTHSSILAWRIPGTEEHGGLESVGSQRVRHDCVTNTFTYFLSHPNVCCSTIYNSQDVEAMQMLRINRWMDKEDVVHIHSGILLSCNKEWMWVICGDVDKPRAPWWFRG